MCLIIWNIEPMLLSESVNKSEQQALSSENPLDWRYWFGEMDTRWVAIFRIFFSLLLLKNAVYNVALAAYFYSDSGVMPRWALFDSLVRTPRFSLMDSIGTTWMAILFFLVWIIVLVALMLGYRARLMAILNFILILSVHERNSYILTSADTLMRVMSFWLMFAPIAQYYALDTLRRRWRLYRASGRLRDLRIDDAPRTAFALPVRMMQIQLILVYACTAYLKVIGSVWQQGDTMHYVLQIDTMMLPFGYWMRTLSPEFLRWISWFAMYAEIALPVLLLMPIFWSWSRGLAFMIALALHGGIAIALSIADFSIVMLLCFLPFFDPQWMLFLGNLPKRKTEKIILPTPLDLNSPLWLWLSLTREDDVRLSGEIYNDKLEYDNFYVIADGEQFRGRAAWQKLSAHLPLSRLWSWLLNFDMLRAYVWSIMGLLVWRFRMKTQATENPTSPENILFGRIILSIVLIFLMQLVIRWNISTTSDYTDTPVPYPLAKNVVWYTGLWQYWDMFSPLPIQYDGWIVIEGHFEDNVTYDLLTKRPVDYETPTRWYWGPDMRWEKYEEVVFRYQYDALLNGWASYYCRFYNVRLGFEEGKRLATLEINMHYINFYPPDGSSNTYQTDTLWNHWCFDEYEPE